MTEMNPTFADVWDTLSKVSVGHHIEKKNGLSYLSWMWAWTYLMGNYPQSTIEWAQDSEGYNVYTYQDGVRFMPDKTAEVKVGVRIGEHVYREMWLPVMDNRNKAIASPDSRQISDTKMRCLVKCIALLGLGWYVFAGEDVPTDPRAEAEVIAAAEDLKAAVKAYMQDFGRLDDERDAEARGIIQSGDAEAMKSMAETVRSIHKTKKEATSE